MLQGRKEKKSKSPGLVCALKTHSACVWRGGEHLRTILCSSIHLHPPLLLAAKLVSITVLYFRVTLTGAAASNSQEVGLFRGQSGTGLPACGSQSLKQGAYGIFPMFLIALGCAAVASLSRIK